MKKPSQKPVSHTKLASNVRSLSTAKRKKILAFVPMLAEIIAQNQSKY